MKARKTKTSNRKKTAVAKDRDYELRHDFRVGDKVKVLDIGPELKDMDQPDNDMRTAELFRACLLQEFFIRGFGRYGHPELCPGDNSAINKEFGKLQSIWIEPEYLRLVTRSRKISLAQRQADGFGWKANVLKEEKKLIQQKLQD